jgi:periplasmic copper chaperone A
VISFQVPTQSETASTVGLKVQLPPDQPLAVADVAPKAGWTHTVTTTKLATPIQTDDGPVSEAPSVIEWKAASGGIKPGEFDQFSISAGPLPKAESMTFKVIQTYSDGKQVAWVEESTGGAEPEHPAPVLKLAAAAPPEAAPSAGPTVTAAPSAAPVPAPDAASKGSVTGAYLVAAIGVLIGLTGVALAVAARRRPERQPTPQPASETTAQR